MAALTCELIGTTQLSMNASSVDSKFRACSHHKIPPTQTAMRSVDRPVAS
jgi:hypothetical protein